MINLKRAKNNKWIIQKNINSAAIIKQFLYIAKRLNNSADKAEMLKEFKKSGYYKGRSPSGSENTMGVRTSEMKFWMFGYSIPGSPKGTFVLSPTALNICKDRTTSNIAKNSLVNLFGLQYPHPFSDTSSQFKIEAGKLIIHLLLDKRIEEKLYIDEACYFLPFLESIDSNSYEELIDSILEFRKLSFCEKDQLFKTVPNYNDLFGNVFHEFNYYFLRIFEALGVFSIIEDPFYNSGLVHVFRHGKGTPRNDSCRSRKKIPGFFTINKNIVAEAKILDKKFSCFDKPISRADVDILSKQDFVLKLYQQRLTDYLCALDPTLSKQKIVNDIVFNMVHMSKYGSKDGKDFENALKPFFELFREATNVEVISGSGDTDLLCDIRDQNTDEIYKINVDGKTSGTSTSSLNPARLNKHLVLNGSRYCIVVSSRFASGVATDLNGYNIVAITAQTLADYCLNSLNCSNDGYANFSMLESIIAKNIGNNITQVTQNFISNYFGV